MSVSVNEWKSMAADHPCPICGKPDWCGRAGEVVRCMRREEAPIGWRLIKKDDEGGTVFGPETPDDFAARHERYQKKITAQRLRLLATELGVRHEALRAIGCGWTGNVWTVPECNPSREIIGISTRSQRGGKRCIKGSKRGLIIPDELPEEGVVLVVEGASDVAAGLTMGLNVIGRPSAGGGFKHLARFLSNREIVVLGENDRKQDGRHPGQEGAARLAQRLAREWRRSVPWTLPPAGAKDLRAWLGGHDVDVADVEACRDLGRQFMAAIENLTEAAEPDGSGSATDDSGDGGSGGERRSQATDLVRLCESIELFHDDGDAYASIAIDDRVETLPVRGKAFRRWLARLFYQVERKTPGGQAIADAINVLEGKAHFEGPDINVHVRLAEHEGATYLDLADDRRNIVRITECGWEVVRESPVRFRRPKGVLPLPLPKREGSLDELRRFINLDRDEDFILVVAWLVGIFRIGRPVPILTLISEQGSGKSTCMRLLRLLVDPNRAPLRSSPREPRDLMIAAKHSCLIVLDNLSAVPDWLSDALCRLSTGGGFSTRTLYENDEEQLFDSLRPVMLNGIEDLATRSDLLDRSIRIGLPSIPEEARLPENILFAKFDEARPRLLGGLLTAVSTALSRVGDIRLERCPRMADFASWVAAAEPAMPWAQGEFMRAYSSSREGAHDLALEASPISDPVRAFADREGFWEGKASELLLRLNPLVDEPARKYRSWPKSPQGLSGTLRRIAPNLRQVGVHVDFPERDHRGRRIVIRKVVRDVVTVVTDRHRAALRTPDGDARDDVAPGRDDAVTMIDHDDAPAMTQRDDGDDPLRSCPSGRNSDEVAFEERAAILEFDGGLSRQEAEARVRREMLNVAAATSHNGSHSPAPIRGAS